MRPVPQPARVGFVEPLHRDGRCFRRAAHFVQRREPVVAIERRVFHAFRGHGRRVLLQAHDEPPEPRPVLRTAAVAGRHEQDVEQEVEHGRVRGLAAALRPRDGLPQKPLVGRVDVLPDHVRSVHGEVRDRLEQRAAQPAQAEVTRVRVGFRNAVELGRQHVQLARQGCLHDQSFGAIQCLGVGGRIADEGAIVELERGQSVGPHEQPAREVRILVAGGSVHEPVVAQRLAGRENLFGHHVERALAGHVLAERPGGVRLQTAKVSGGIVQPVRVVDAQPLELAARDQIEHERVRGVEDLPHSPCARTRAR